MSDDNRVVVVVVVVVEVMVGHAEYVSRACVLSEHFFLAFWLFDPSLFFYFVFQKSFSSIFFLSFFASKALRRLVVVSLLCAVAQSSTLSVILSIGERTEERINQPIKPINQPVI